MDPQTTLSEDNLFLLQELPDPQQELVIQTLLDEFHYFSKLPKELRLMIWRDTFPRPRDIRLPDWSFCPEGSLDFRPIFPPITSQLNRESRDETNLHYLLFWIPSDDTSGGPSRQRLCFAPKRDTFVLASYVHTEIYHSNFSAPHLKATYKAIFGRVNKLEIVESFWVDYLRDLRLWDYNLLRQFEVLDELIVERPSKPGPDGFGLASDQEFAICIKSLTDFFDHEKGKDQHFKIPQVIRRDWDEDLVTHNVQHDTEDAKVKWCLYCQRK
jgi:hypothetical protein